MTLWHRARVSLYTLACAFAQTCVFSKQSPGPLRCGLPPHPEERDGRRCISRSYAPLLPSSLTTVLSSALGFSPHPPVLGIGTGASSPCLALFLAIRSATYGLQALLAMSNRPCSSARPRQPDSCRDYQRCRNINLLSIGYAFRPHLRSRLTLGGFTCAQETLGFRRRRFSLLFTLLMPAFSPVCGPALLPVRLQPCIQRSPTAPPGRSRTRPVASAAHLSPVHFRRREARPVRSYPLFK